MEQQHKSTASVVLLVSTAVLGSFFFGYSLTYMNPAIKTANKQFDISKDNETVIDGFINALPPIGAALGALSAGPLLSSMSLRDAFVLTDILGIIGYGLQLPLYLGTLLLARLIIGIAIGLNSTLVPQYIKEFSPKSLSGPLGGMNQMTVNIGMLLALVMGMFFEYDGSSLDYMRFVFDLPMLICAFRIFLLAFVYRDAPPSYYLKIGDDATAKNVISWIYKREYVQEVYEEIKQEVDKKNASESSYSDLFRNPAVKKRLFIACVLQIVQQFCGINAVMIYSSSIFYDIASGTDEEKDNVKNYYNIGVGLVNFVFSFTAVLILNKLGRRPLLLYGTILCSIFLIAITIFSFLTPDEEPAKYGTPIVIFIYSFLAGFQLGLGPVGWIYSADILPEKGMSIAILTNWVCCALIAQFFGIIKNIGGLPLDFLLFSIFCTLGILFIYVYVLETKDKSTDHIEQMFSLQGKTAINY